MLLFLLAFFVVFNSFSGAFAQELIRYMDECRGDVELTAEVPTYNGKTMTFHDSYRISLKPLGDNRYRLQMNSEKGYDHKDFTLTLKSVFTSEQDQMVYQRTGQAFYKAEVMDNRNGGNTQNNQDKHNNRLVNHPSIYFYLNERFSKNTIQLSYMDEHNYQISIMLRCSQLDLD